MRFSKPSPAMVVALVALVFAMTGTGIAAKGLITGKQIKDGSITSKDLARNAVTARNLAKGAVTGRGIAPGAVKPGAIAPSAVTSAAIAPGAVTEGSIAPDAVTAKAIAPAAVGSRSLRSPTLCPSGVIIYDSNCPAVPVPQTWAQGTASDFGINALGPTCQSYPITQFAPLPTGSGSGYYDPAEPDRRLTVRLAGRYSIVADVIWPAAAGATLRTLAVSRILGGGANVGESVKLKYVTEPTTAGGAIVQSLAFAATLEAGDHLRVAASGCGTVSKPSTISLSYNWEGP